jgi:hypothetical protein
MSVHPLPMLSLDDPDKPQKINELALDLDNLSKLAW